MATGPTSELGSAARSVGLPGDTWRVLAQEADHVPEMRWPTLPRTVRLMLTDAQVHGLYLGATMPVRRRRWTVDLDGASDETTARVAADLGLPVRGDDRVRPPQAFGRADRLITRGLLAFAYGRYDMELVGEIRGGRWRLVRAAPRPLWTIRRPVFGEDGALSAIVVPAARPQPGGLSTVELPVDRLVSFVWGDEDQWNGASALRPMYRHWLRKDKLLRVDALKHERNGMGVPVTTEPPGNVSEKQRAALAAVARNLRAGEEVGGNLPFGSTLDLLGVRGTLPDTLASIKYDDQQMSFAWSQTVRELGTSAPGGSYALSQTLDAHMDVFVAVLGDWIANTLTEGIAARSVLFNEGEGAPVPRVMCEEDEQAPASVEDLQRLVDAGLLTPDPELEVQLRARHSLPPRSEEQAPSGRSYQYDLEYQILTVDERRAQIGLPPLPDGAGARLPVTPTPAPAAPASLSAGARRRAPARAAATAQGRELRRNATLAEQSMDLNAIEETYTTTRAELVAAAIDARAAQIDELTAQVEEADGDLADLAMLTCTPIAAAVLAAPLVAAVAAGAGQLLGELAVQGLPQPTVDPADQEAQAEQRAAALAAILAGDLASAARRRAITQTGEGDDGASAAADVREHLEGLSTAYLEQQLGAAVHASQHSGRVEAIRETLASDPAIGRVYASELLDSATCSECVSVDGTEYDSLEDALRDYPAGGYIGCEGGSNCRGTLVLVGAEESAPSVG